MPHSRRRTQGQRQPKRHTAGDSGQAEVEAPESGVSGAAAQTPAQRRARPAGSGCWCSAQAKDQPIAGGGWRRGVSAPFPIMQIASAGAVAIAKDALRPRAIAAQWPVVNGQMVDESGAQLQPSRLPGKPRARQLAAQPPGFSRITKGEGSAGWWRAGSAGRGGKTIEGHLAAGRRRTTGPEYQSPPGASPPATAGRP